MDADEGPRTLDRSATGTAWALGGDVVGQGLRLLAGLLVATSLGPESFAVWSIIMLFIAAGTALDEGGLHQALIVRRPWSDEEQDATFWVSGLVGTCSAVLLVGTASALTTIDDIPEVASYVGVFAVTLVTSTLAVVPRAHLSANLAFRRLALRESTARILGAAATAGLAVATRSIWALVVGVVVQRSCEHVLLWTASPFRPRIRPILSPFRPMLRFTVNATLVNVLGFVSTQVGTLVVAALLDDAALGVWGLATMIFITAQSRLAAVLSRVAFPVFGHITSAGRVTAYLRGLKMVCAALAPVSVAMALLTPFLIDLVLGDEWNLLWPVAVALVPAGLARGIGPFTDAFVYSMNAPEITVRSELVRLPLSFAVIGVAASAWGVVGAAASSAPLLVASIGVRAVLLRRTLGVDLQRWLSTIGIPLGAAVAPGLVVGLLWWIGGQEGSVVACVAVLGAYAALYTALLRLLAPDASTDLLRAAAALRARRPRGDAPTDS